MLPGRQDRQAQARELLPAFITVLPPLLTVPPESPRELLPEAVLPEGQAPAGVRGPPEVRHQDRLLPVLPVPDRAIPDSVPAADTEYAGGESLPPIIALSLSQEWC